MIELDSWPVQVKRNGRCSTPIMRQNDDGQPALAGRGETKDRVTNLKTFANIYLDPNAICMKHLCPQRHAMQTYSFSYSAVKLGVR